MQLHQRAGRQAITVIFNSLEATFAVWGVWGWGGGAGRWTEMDCQSDTATMFSVGLCTYGCFHAGAMEADDCFNETADFHHRSRNTHTHAHTRRCGGCGQTCECLDTQWRSTLRTLLVAARRMMKSLSQVLSEFVKTVGKIKTIKEVTTSIQGGAHTFTNRPPGPISFLIFTPWH